MTGKTSNGAAAETILRTAQRYIGGGLSVHPIRTDGTKAPALSEWKYLQSRRANEGELSKWFGNGRRKGVGIIAGSVSGNLEIIDFDEPGLFHDYAKLVEEQMPDLMDRLTLHETPKGDTFHLAYRCDAIGANEKLAQKWATDEDGRQKTETLIETRGEGGYIVAPGSPVECHDERRPYMHVAGPPIEQAPTITPAERIALMWAARSFNRAISEPRQPAPATPRTDSGNLSPGDDFNQRGDWSFLERHGWQRLHASGDIEYWKRPGKTGAGWSATTGCKSKAGNELFCVFSSNAFPFDVAPGDTCGSYSRFAAYATLEHDGDFPAAARELGQQGYGESERQQAAAGDNANQLLSEQSTDDADDGRRLRYQCITSRELDAATYNIEYLIEGCLVAGQPGIVAGGKKCLKTSVLIDLAIALASGGCFLGRLRANRACRVLVMSGESGLPTIQETARRICKAAGIELADQQNLIWSTDLPQFGSFEHLDALESLMVDERIEMVVVDPAYLCLGAGGDAGNLMAQGQLLRGPSDVCQKLGATFILAHHTRKGGKFNPFDPPELEDIAWAGFQEYARQWLLLGRREPYEPGTGEHRLWLNLGGSAGHSSLWGLDVSEGVYSPDTPRHWNATLMKHGDVKQATEDRAKADKEAREAEKLQADVEKMLKAMVAIPDGDTKSAIADRAGMNRTRIGVVLAKALDDGNVVACEVTKGNHKRPYEAYKLSPKMSQL